MTIHVVTEDYDEGDVVFQASVDISDCKTAEDIASKVLALEHEYYPSVVGSDKRLIMEINYTEIMKSTRYSSLLLI